MKFDKNIFIYQDSINFSRAPVSFKKKRKIPLSHHGFLFLPLWLHTKKPTIMNSNTNLKKRKKKTLTP